MTESLGQTEGRQIYLLGVMSDDGNSWEELIEVRGLEGILRFLDDHQLELMYGKRMTVTEAEKWMSESSSTRT